MYYWMSGGTTIKSISDDKENIFEFAELDI